jgi:anti-sigma-K factor RskA
VQIVVELILQTRCQPDDNTEQKHERNFMMNNTNGWMGGWAGGGMWLWTVIGVAVVVLLVVVIAKLSKK